MPQSILLRAPRLDDAGVLHQYLVGSSVLANLAWDGPSSEQEYRDNWATVVTDVAHGARHFFVITHPESREPVGSCDVRPDEHGFSGTLGLWIAEPYQGRGFGTKIVGELVAYAFDVLCLHRLRAEVFVGNWASRTALERNGFVLEGTTRESTLKFGVPRDDWHFGLINPASRFQK
jgi:ribosomal-protein-alanine N-acetyltransferase